MCLTAEEGAEIETLPVDLQTETVVDFRNARIADGHFVVCVDHSVAVVVEVFHVTRTYRTEFLLGAQVDFVLVFEQT